MVSAVRDEHLAWSAVQNGADDYVTKPVDLEYLSTSSLMNYIQRVGGVGGERGGHSIPSGIPPGRLGRFTPRPSIAAPDERKPLLRPVEVTHVQGRKPLPEPIQKARDSDDPAPCGGDGVQVKRRVDAEVLRLDHVKA